MNHENRVRDMERAAVDRWFAQTPLGPMFHAGRGRTLPVPADAIQPWRDEAHAIIDKFIVDSRPPAQWAMVGILLAFTCLLLALKPWIGLEGGQIGVIVMGGLALWHVDDFWRLWCYRRDLRALRGRIAASLALRTPIPEEIAGRFRRGNPWRIALQLWVWSFVAIALLSSHFVPPEAIDRGIFLFLLAAVGIAWILYFLSRRVDLGQG